VQGKLMWYEHGRAPALHPCSPPPSAHNAQAYTSRARVEGFSLVADMMYVAQNAPRIARALFEIVLRKKWAGAAGVLLEICKARARARGARGAAAACDRASA
jgi:hypothetical protein